VSVTFEEFVRTQTEETNEAGTDIEKEKQEWAERIEELYETVKKHLSEYTESKRIEIEPRIIRLHEDRWGIYEAQALTITIGKKVIELEPKGRFVVGAFGRVDMTGPAGIVKIVLVDEGLGSPHISVTISHGGKKEKTSPRFSPSEKKVWKLSTPLPHIKYYDLDEENFLDALMQVANG
jgi:hypothetical protein